jgi:hypothetical protein
MRDLDEYRKNTEQLKDEIRIVRNVLKQEKGHQFFFFYNFFPPQQRHACNGIRNIIERAQKEIAAQVVCGKVFMCAVDLKQKKKITERT